MKNRLPLTPSDLIVIGGYLLLVLSIGFYYRKRMHSTEDYFAGGHQVPWWLAGVSHYISGASALSFVAYAQLGYTYGLTAITLAWVSIPGCLLGGAIFARRWRQAHVVTPVEFLERRFNPFVRQLFAWAGIPMKVAEDGLKLFATSLFLAVGLNISVTWAILVCGVITIAYTFLGGLWALMITDYIQFLMKVLALLLLVPIAFWRVGGIRHALQVLPPSFFHATGGQYNLTYLIGFGVMLTITLNGSWALAQKFYSVTNTREASKAAYLSAILHVVGPPLMILPAILGRSFLPNLIAQHRTDDVYVLLVLNLLPAGMVGIIVAAMLSATMATVSADFSSIASVLTKDVYQRLFRPHLSPERLVWVGKLITLLTGGLSVAIGLYISHRGDVGVLHMMVVIASAFIAPSFLPIMGALVSRRLNWQGVVVGFFLGLASGLTLLALRTWWLPLGHWRWLQYNFDGASILINTAITIAGMGLGTLVFGVAGSQQEKFNQVFGNAEYPALRIRGKLDQQRVIAFSTLAVGSLLGLAGIVATSRSARITDLGIAVCLLSLGSYRLRSNSRAVAIFSNLPAEVEEEALVKTETR
jgi:solute:Na+ symporter, SSS family